MKPVVRARWQKVVLVCGKCSKRIGGGFGPDGDRPLAKAHRKHLSLTKGRKASAGVVEVTCLGVCPKGAVAVVDGARPTEWRLVRPGADLDRLAEDLQLKAPADQA